MTQSRQVTKRRMEALYGLFFSPAGRRGHQSQQRTRCMSPAQPAQASQSRVSPGQLPQVLAHPSPSFCSQCCSNPLHPHRGAKGWGASEARNYWANPVLQGLPPVLHRTFAPRYLPHSGPRPPLHAQPRSFLTYRLGQSRKPGRMQVRHTIPQLYRDPSTWT